jgi:hypothetical protein
MQLQITDANPHQAQSGMSNCSRHPPHLPISSLGQRDLQPGGGHALAITDGRITRRKRGLFMQQANLCRPAAVVADGDSGSKALQRYFIRNTFDLHPVGSGMTELWVRKPMLQGAIVGQEQKALAVVIETPSRINRLDWDILLERASLAGKLATNTKRLVEEDIAVTQTSDYNICGHSTSFVRSWHRRGGCATRCVASQRTDTWE